MPPVPAPLSVEVRFRVVMVPVPAATPPLIVICPLPLPLAVVIKSNVLVLPADDAANVTEPVLLRKALPAVLAERLLAVVKTRASEAPMSPEVEAKLTVVAVR